MKGKWRLVLLAAMIFALHSMCAWSAFAESGRNGARWTVMFYMCGSDLESKYSYATGNLSEIAASRYPAEKITSMLEEFETLQQFASVPEGDRVNVVIETGGSREWYAQALGMDISTTALQRWHYNCYLDDDTPEGFFLDQTLPLQSMADPDTLSDFIRWSAEYYPAEKYALVLWDHGGGSKTGLMIDELFEGDVLFLDELGQALHDGGVHLEAVLFDACLMANMETAYAIRENANWMIASE